MKIEELIRSLYDYGRPIILRDAHAQREITITRVLSKSSDLGCYIIIRSENKITGAVETNKTSDQSLVVGYVMGWIDSGGTIS